MLNGMKLLLATWDKNAAIGMINKHKALGNVTALLHNEKEGTYSIFLVAENPELPEIRKLYREISNHKMGSSHWTSNHNSNGG